MTCLLYPIGALIAGRQCSRVKIFLAGVLSEWRVQVDNPAHLRACVSDKKGGGMVERTGHIILPAGAPTGAGRALSDDPAHPSPGAPADQTGSGKEAAGNGWGKRSGKVSRSGRDWPSSRQDRCVCRPVGGAGFMGWQVGFNADAQVVGFPASWLLIKFRLGAGLVLKNRGLMRFIDDYR
jgi:hypothetical protein